MGKLKNGIDEKSAKRKIEFKVMMGVTYMTYKTKTPLTHIIPQVICRVFHSMAFHIATPQAQIICVYVAVQSVSLKMLLIMPDIQNFKIHFIIINRSHRFRAPSSLVKIENNALEMLFTRNMLLFLTGLSGHVSYSSTRKMAITNWRVSRLAIC